MERCHDSASNSLIKLPKYVEMYHFSWTYLLTIAHLLIKKNDNNIYDEDQKQSAIILEVLLSRIKPDIFHLHSLAPNIGVHHLKLVSKCGIKTFYTPRLANNFCINNGQLIRPDKKTC